ncbi:MAG: hypothetical protein PVJ86_00360 [Phycisphaerales bacterium]|jgi:hypothetical protein
MSKEICKALILTALLAACVAAGLLLPARAAPPPAPLTADFTAGMSDIPSGSPVAGSCFTLTFSASRRWVIISNQTGADAYYLLNDTGCATSATVYDQVLDDGEDMVFDGWIAIDHITVYVTPTSGFTMAGW